MTDDAAVFPLNELWKKYRRQQRRIRALLALWAVTGLLLAGNLLWNTSTQIAFDHCIRYTQAHNAPVGTCHDVQRPDPIGFVGKWLFP